MNTQPTAGQPLVTHADLGWLTEARKRLAEKSIGCDYPMLNGLDRLIAAAEADKPALPKGWVLRRGAAVHWHQSGCLYNNPASLVMTWNAQDTHEEHRQGTLTPLVTAASLVPEGWHVDERDGGIRTTEGRLIASVDSRAYDVLAKAVRAAQAERGESR